MGKPLPNSFCTKIGNVSVAGDPGVEEWMNASGLGPVNHFQRRLFISECFDGINGGGAVGWQQRRENHR